MKNKGLYLRLMTLEQFEYFKIYSCEMYARVSPHYREMPFAEALKIIVNDFNARFAPEGLDTPGQFFIAIMQDDQQVGYFHFSEFPKGSKSVFGWNFHIFDNYQRSGLGKASAVLAKLFLKEKGYSKVALNVLANNEAAIKIYESFDFKVTQLSMESDIT